LNAIFLLLGVIGVIIVILGIFLVYNSISAIVSQQIGQIGVMKAIGASSWQVVWSYLVLVLSYGLLASIISIPIGAVAAFGLQNFFANFLNLEIETFAIDRTAVMVQVAISIIAPLLAALVPLAAGTRITVREAIGSYGLTGTIGFIDRMVAKSRNIPYTLLLTIGNTFRNRRRVFFVQVALVVAGVIFMMVIGVNDATKYTFGDKLAGIHNYQVTLSMAEPARAQEIENTALDIPDVSAVDSWLVLPASARPVSQADKEVTDARITVFGQPPETEFYRPEMRAGRWLQPGDVNSAVVSLRVSDDKGWQVGDWLTLTDSNNREFDVEIVGVLFDPATNSSVHLPLSTLQQEWGSVDKVNTVWVQAGATGIEDQEIIAGQLTQALEQRSIEVSPRSTFGETTIAGIIDQNSQRNSIIINLLAVMAVVIALVGGVGLSGVLSLSVLERRREIGVMRAIGASSWQVIRLFVGEAMLLGVISWLIALPLSIPAAYGLATRGLSFALNQQLSYSFTPSGAIAWLVIITLLAVVASLFPARGAARVSVRESLAYQ
jgi:putative ABC transport system permease protein